MDAERWKQVNEIFHAALERPESERAEFIADASGDDAALRAEVESLLRSHNDSDDFIETPAFESAAALLQAPTGEKMAAAAEALIGKQLGQYVIRDSLGYGGMGVVYLADDTRLDRPVAIKALADHLGADERSRARLRREAKAAAALPHDGIATVYALEEFDGHLYVVYEYVEGETLREAMSANDFSDGDALRIGAAVSEALAAAHDAGIVHRDLKPENIICTSDGGVKVLDFGLASFQQPAVPPAVSGEDQVRLTLPGMLLGTPSYMSPEQLKGREVDFRSDLFSLGVVLYEMLSRVHPFEGDDPASTIARILEVEPRRPPGDVADADLAHHPVVRQLLAKDPSARPASTAEVASALRQAADSGTAPVARVGYPDEPTSTTSASEVPDAAPTVVDPGAYWWWRFHQSSVSVTYGLTAYCLWLAKQWSAGSDYQVAASALFYVGVAAVILAGSLRLHLMFAAHTYPAELARQFPRSMPWIRRAEFAYAVVLFGGASLIDRTDSLPGTALAAFMIAAAMGILTFAQMIEPTTTRAAFPMLRGRSVPQ